MVEYKNVMIGIDGSKQSQAAFQKGLRVAKESGATLHLVSVINGEQYPSGATLGYGFVDRGLYDNATKKMTAVLDQMKEESEAAGVKDVRTDVIIGNAKVELAENYPKENHVDLIVIGASGLNVIGRMIVGSTAAYVVRQAPCDVTVVKTDVENKLINVKHASYPEL
jgi:nucleotide-binding universal stress UspA family protein